MGREFTAAGGYTTRDLVTYARDHMASARVLFQASFDCYDSAGYLSHLGIELLLKAFLLHHAGRFPDEHDLGRLLRLVQEHDPTITLSDAERGILTQVDTFNFSRYPVPKNPVEIGTEDWEGIEQLWHTLARGLPPALQEEMRSKVVPTPANLQSCTDAETVMMKGDRILMRRKKRDPEAVAAQGSRPPDAPPALPLGRRGRGMGRAG